VRFVLFGCIWYRLAALRKWVQNEPKWCKSSWHEVVSEFFTTNAPNPPHWAQNSCFIAFHTILVHLGPFGCVTKFSAKWAKLMQKFVPRSRIGIFRNERTQSAPLDSKLMFWCVLYCLDAFGTVWLPYKTQCKMGRSGEKVRATKSRHNFSQRTHRIDPLGPKLMFWCVLYYLGAFGTVWLPNKTGCKTSRSFAKVRAMKSCQNFSQQTTRSNHWSLTSCFSAFRTIWVHSGEFGCVTTLNAKWTNLVQKFVPRSHIRIFCNEHTRSTPLDSKLMFWCVLYYLVAFGTVWLPYKTQCQTCRTSAEVCATKSRLNFSQQTHPIGPVGT
jgi:hypothetical protein